MMMALSKEEQIKLVLLSGWEGRPGPVVLNFFYISYPFIKQDYQIYP